jgi:Ca2+-binding RTX toxin-like protein
LAEKYLDSQKGIFALPLNPIRIVVLSGIICILFLSSSSNNVNGKTIICQNENKKTCKGSERTDVLVGNKNSNKMNGFQGTDYIIGLFGNDYIIGYDGSDSLIGGSGNDIIHGGGSNDSILGNTGNDRQ